MTTTINVLQADEVRRRVEAGRERERNALLLKLQEEEELLRKRMADEVCSSAAILQLSMDRWHASHVVMCEQVLCLLSTDREHCR
jgi:hypothetical protein